MNGTVARAARLGIFPRGASAYEDSKEQEQSGKRVIVERRLNIPNGQRAERHRARHAENLRTGHQRSYQPFLEVPDRVLECAGVTMLGEQVRELGVFASRTRTGPRGQRRPARAPRAR
jgi:hypothetical protein